jgi:TetR/AcrR family transcriptional repressor of nem operon
VDDICAAARLTKGSFFHYFDGKEQLALEAVRRFYRRGQEMMAAAPGGSDPDPLKRILGRLDAMAELSRTPMAPRGCLLGTMAQELADSDRKVRSACAECFTDWNQRLRADLDAAKAMHSPQARFSAEGLADYFIATIEGSLILVKSKQNPAPLTEALGHLKRYLVLLFDRNSQDRPPPKRRRRRK